MYQNHGCLIEIQRGLKLVQEIVNQNWHFDYIKKEPNQQVLCRGSMEVFV